MVEIKRVRYRKDRKYFIKFENKLYSECEFFIPRIYKEESKLFSSKHNPYLFSNESTAYLAYQEGKIVGRVLCFFNRIEKENENIIRFSHLDFINDTEVSFALFDMIDNWARFLKADKIIGDMSFSELGNIGILNSGHDKFATFQHRCNYPYYAEHLKSYGYSQSKKLNEYQLILSVDSYKNDLLIENKYKFVDGDKLFKIKNYGRKIFDLLYENSISGYPTVIENKVYEQFFKNIDKLYQSDDLMVIINDNDDVVGAMLVTTNTSLALQTTGGKVLASKNYNVDKLIDKFLDITMLAINRNDADVIEKMLAEKLVSIMTAKNIRLLNTNLWLNNYKDSVFAECFNINWHRDRVVFNKKLGKLTIKRSTSDMATPNNKGNSSII